MAVKKAKTTTRKVKDKWKAKEWYKLYAPKMFNAIELGETPSAEPSDMMSRTIEATVHELTGDFSKMHIKIRFKVTDVRGLEAHTSFVGHDLTSDYVRRLTRRKRTKTDHVVDVHTKDGFTVRVKPMSITEQRIQASQETAVRGLMTKALQEQAANMTVSELVKGIISGDLAKDLSNAVKIIIPIKRIEIRKTEVLKAGTPAAEEPSIQEKIGQEAAAAEAAAKEAMAVEASEVAEEEKVAEEEVPTASEEEETEEEAPEENEEVQ